MKKLVSLVNINIIKNTYMFILIVNNLINNNVWYHIKLLSLKIIIIYDFLFNLILPHFLNNSKIKS